MMIMNKHMTQTNYLRQYRDHLMMKDNKYKYSGP